MFDKARLKAMMVLRGVTASELCKAVGICKTSWSRRVNGKVSFTLDETVKIARFLGMTQEDIMGIFFAKAVSNK